jgi:hypothetical protein
MIAMVITEMDTGIIALKFGSHKRRRVEPEAKPQKTLVDYARTSTEPGKDDFLAAITVKSEWEPFSDAEKTHIGACFNDVLKTSSKSQFVIQPATTHFNVHFTGLSGITHQDMFRKCLKELNNTYRVLRVNFNLRGQFVDVAIQPRSGHSKATEMQTIVRTGQVSYISRPKKDRPASVPELDWVLLANIYHHAEHLMGPDTPAGIIVDVITPSGEHLSTLESKTERKGTKDKTYRILIKGYTQINIMQLRSFKFLHPFHVSQLHVDWDIKSVGCLLSPHDEPLTGDVVDVFDDASNALA